MKKIQILLLALMTVLMGFSSSLHAEDIDLYVDNAVTAGTPNILFVIDTGANFSSSAAVPCTAYASGGAPSMGDTAGGIEQCALVDAIASLGDSVVNIGIMVNNNNNFATDTRNVNDAAYHETCSGTYGGCLVRKLKLMDASGKTSLINFIKSWKTSGTNSSTEFNVKSGGDRTANTMQEAWAYYTGKTGMSGKNYGSSILQSGCQKNFIIFIGNAFNNSGTPADGGSESPYNGTYGLTATQTGATANQKLKIATTQKFGGLTCGVTSIVAGSSTSDWSQNWADEWARLMYQQDAGAPTQESAQNIVTYSIGIVNDASCKPDYPALLSSMATVGGGQYFKTSNASEVKTALDRILNEVQAVNSVFASASLPVSVNAEGNFLNQIFLGMFRPDSSGAPRWVGNLKQYQLVKNDSGRDVMGDANGVPALSSSGTGFVQPGAVSFWTYEKDGATPNGFFVNNMMGLPKSGMDSPDGEVVEKGGAAQQLRKQSLTADFAGASGSTTNPRRVYTYCPAGLSCVAALTDASNDFSTANAGISAAAFGSSTTVPISSIVRSGSTATVTTNASHGFTTGASVTISNVTQSEYNGTFTVTVTGSDTFTYPGLPDYPTSPSAGTYKITSVSGSPIGIDSIKRSSSTTGTSNTETATVTTASPHGYSTALDITITGATQSAYNFSGRPSSAGSTTFTFPVTIDPPSTALNTYAASLSPSAYTSKSVSLSKSGSNTAKGTTSAAHGYWIGQSVTVSGSSEPKFNGTFTITGVPSLTEFTFAVSGLGSPATTSGTVAPDAAGKTVTLKRDGTLDTVKVTASGAPDYFFGKGADATTVVNIARSGGSAGNESNYVKSDVRITCVDAKCNSFTYTTSTTPSVDASGTMTVGTTGATSVSLPAGAITRAGSVATLTGLTSGAFINGQKVTISATGTPLGTESAYVGSWELNCSAPCTTATISGVVQTPSTPATGVNMQAYSGSTPPERDTVIKWVRGADNYGDEKGPGGTVTVRPSIHGDVLHSRPVVINYGDSRGVVVFYGSNDGLYRAVNGSQAEALGSVPAGGELWSLVLKEHYGELNRQRVNSPELKFPSSTLASAQPKDYFVDGSTGIYQRYRTNGSIDKAYIYLTMRRGGRFIYAIDVTTPTAPTVLWKIDNSTVGFEEMGQTWSRPRLTLLQRGGTANRTTPVLVFGGGYDPAEDREPPSADAMGRSLYVVNAETGALIWSASASCVSSSTCLNVPGMTHAIPSDIRFVDRDLDGFTDKLYFGDLGGNLWRADVNTDSPASWQITKVAALGCASGTCPSGTTPRKFFFPPEVLTVGPSGTTGSYDVIFAASGDREHPLKSTASGSSYGIADKAFVIKDVGTTPGLPLTTNVTLGGLFDATSTAYNDTLNGFYISFATGEKAVNTPLATKGLVFFATNKPIDRTSTCAANLGEAKSYAVNPFSAAATSTIVDGGGLPPGSVSGLVTTTNADGTRSTSDLCIGCGGAIPLENTPPAVAIDKKLRRTYWYKK